jgi:AhpD family alkylhydroperoxidase
MEQRHIEIANLFKQMKENFPKELGGFLTMSQQLEHEGAISAKNKELILVALAVSTGCEKCMAFHIRNAVNKGATKQEILEAAILNLIFGGGQALMSMTVVYEELEIHFD